LPMATPPVILVQNFLTKAPSRLTQLIIVVSAFLQLFLMKK